MWVLASTWCMSLNGSKKAAEILDHGGSGADALAVLICDVEADPCFTSVGYGGLPDEDGNVFLDAGFMNGTTMETGAVMGLTGFLHPFLAARLLSKRKTDCILQGEGAAEYARKMNLQETDLRTESSLARWKFEREKQEVPVYRGHDTVGAVVMDTRGDIYAGTSTSGLFLKKKGRVGDSPLAGSGFYADSEAGAAAATGLGEDLVKGCLSYETVRLMKEGLCASEACYRAVEELSQRLERAGRAAGDLSVVAISKNGDYGAASNIGTFSFVTCSSEEKPAVYLSLRRETGFAPASEEWIREYMRRHGKF